MKATEKIKRFWNKHGNVIKWLTISLGASTCAFIIGTIHGAFYTASGAVVALDKLTDADPELLERLNKACDVAIENARKN